MKTGFRNLFFNRWSAFAHDLLWVPLCLFASYWFRFNLGKIPPEFLNACFILMGMSLPIFWITFRFFGLYRGIWRFASIKDLSRIVKSVALGTLILSLFSAVFFRLEGVPRSVFFLFPLLLTLGLTVPRFFYRGIKDHSLKPRKKEGQRTLIVGAGRSGVLLLRDLIHRQEYLPVAFADDDPKKHKREISGVRVHGGIAKIPKIVRRLDIDLVVLAIPSADKETVQKIVAECAACGVKFRTIPTPGELSGKNPGADQIRPVTLRDLLGREAVNLDTRSISASIRGKTVLVTGGGGSIGSELCRQVAGQKPNRLIIFDSSEFNLYRIEHELVKEYPEVPIEAVLGNITDRDRISWLFEHHRPEVVFHAAAYKHVPMLEHNPAEGVLNNIFGTKIVADAADRFTTERFVLVSTDKAVNPTSLMGATKRVGELYCQNLSSRSRTSFITTRFGNVLRSAGSVVPLFEKQIKEGGPVTVTHRAIRRYFMTITEAAGLILQAAAMNGGGKIYVLDMGEPVLIKDLAEKMIRLFGKEPGRDIQIAYIGLRPGEKLQEEMFHEKEKLRGTNHPKLLLATSRDFSSDWLEEQLNILWKATRRRDITDIIRQLHILVPEYEGLNPTLQKNEPDLRMGRVISAEFTGKTQKTEISQ